MSTITTAPIDSKISTALRESKSLAQNFPQVNISREQKINEYLDGINELSGKLTELHKILLRLTFEIERDFQNFEKSGLAPTEVPKLIALLIRMLNKVQKCKYFPGVKTLHSEIKQETSFLNELFKDSKISRKLKSDTEMEAIIDATINAAKHA